MQFYRCKCGETVSHTSMGVPDCSKCDKCGSDLAQAPTLHEEPKPHEYVTRYDRNTGTPFEMCTKCMQRKPEACRACGKELLHENKWMSDGCPCNSARGVNHGLVAKNVCTCTECDPAQTGSPR